MMNFFISSYKFFSYSKYLNFCLEFLVIGKRKISLISKLMTSQPRERTITIPILLSITGNEGSQAMKFGQFIE